MPNPTSNIVLELIANLETKLAAHPKLKLLCTPVTAEALEEAEQKLGVRLPPSYRELVLTHGTIQVEWAPGRYLFWMLPIEDLGIVEPTAWIDEGDDDVDARIDRAIFFAYADDNAVENFYAFDREKVDKQGEMRVSLFRHDDVFKLDGKMSFADYVAAQIEEVLEDVAAGE